MLTLSGFKYHTYMLALEDIIDAEIQRQESELELGSFSDAELVKGEQFND